MKKLRMKTKIERISDTRSRKMVKTICKGHARSTRRHGVCVRCQGSGNTWAAA